MKNNQNGRSMVEMLGVLAIIGVLSAGGLAGYSKAMFKHKLNSTMDQITMLVTGIRTAWGQKGNYNGLTQARAYQLGVIPAVMTTNNGTNLTNPFKGSVSITLSKAKEAGIAAGTTEDPATAFVLTYGGLPKEACIALATADFGSGAGSGFIGVKAFGAAQTNKGTEAEPNMADNTAADLIIGTGGDGRAEGVVYTMANAITACASETSTVSWKFY